MRRAGPDVSVDDRPAMRKAVVAVAWPKADYVASLERAGAAVRALTPADALPGSLDGCDALLLTGGVDVDPAVLYGDPARHPTLELDEVRDGYELALAREALARDLPVLAICRGAQVLNVAAGGTLIQDIPSALPSSLEHSRTEPKDAIAHRVQVRPGTRLHDLLGLGVPSEGALRSTAAIISR